MGSHLSEFVSVPALTAVLLCPVAGLKEVYLTLREALSHVSLARPRSQCLRFSSFIPLIAA